MIKQRLAILLGVVALIAFPATIRTQTGVMSPGDIVGCTASTCPTNVSLVIGTYGPTTRSTASATVGSAVYRLGSLQAGTSVRIGTCGMADAAFTGNTFLRLFIAGTTTQVAFNNDNCGGPGSQINYVVPHDMSLELHAGCSGDSIGCAGRISMLARLDATPRPAGVKAAFRRVFNDGVLGISPDIHTLIRGINYQGAGWGEKYHHQGIARTYNRTTYDIAWTMSVRDDGGPEFNNVFFTRMGTKASGLTQRFRSNLFETLLPGLPPVVVQYASPLDAVIFGSNAGVYDEFDTDDPQSRDWDGVPLGRKFDHGGGIQAIGNYIVAASEFVSRPCTPYLNDCPPHGNWNIPPSGQASQVVAYNIALPSPQPSLLIARKNQGSGWVAIAKLGPALAPPVLRNGYLIMVPDGNELSLYAVSADPCTGYASLAQVKPSFAMGHRTPPAIDPLVPRVCPGVRSAAQQAAADVSQVSYLGCVKRTTQWVNPPSDPDCPNLVAMYVDGGYIDFPSQADVQSANFVTQANGQLYLLAFEGQQIEYGPNSEVQLWRVVFGTASGAAVTLRTLPDGTECEPFLCLVRAGTEDARDSFKNMHVDDINGAMFRFGGGAYIVPNANPALETFFMYGTEHYLQKTPRAARFNEF
jgi:hypothetical protein